MAKFRFNDIFFKDDDMAIFGTDQDSTLFWDGTLEDLRITSTVSGVYPIQNYHLTTKYYVDQGDIDDFLELTDTPDTYSNYADYVLKVSNSEDGVIFGPPTVFSGTTPPASGTGGIWYNNGDSILYYWDETRGKWLSVFTHNYLFTYSGNIDGLYMSVGNVVNSYAHFHILRDATITAVTADQDSFGSSEPNKGYEIQANTVNVFGFNMVSHSYTNEAMNVDISANDSLQMYVVSAGARVRDPIVTLELRWRYE